MRRAECAACGIVDDTGRRCATQYAAGAALLNRRQIRKGGFRSARQTHSFASWYALNTKLLTLPHVAEHF